MLDKELLKTIRVMSKMLDNEIFSMKYVIVFILLFNCKQDEYRFVDETTDGYRFIKKSHLDSSNIQHVVVYDLDDDLYKKYTLVNNLKEGKEFFYFKESKKIESEINFKNDTIDGLAKWYYNNENNTLKYIANYENGTSIGNHIEYYKNSSLKRYFSVSVNNEIIYQRRYDSLGGIINELGSYKTFGMFNDMNFKSQDSIFYTAYISTPNKTDVKYFISLVKEGGNDNWKEMKIKNSKAIFKTLLKDKGKYLFKEKLVIKHIYKDSVSVEYYKFDIEN